MQQVGSLKSPFVYDQKKTSAIQQVYSPGGTGSNTFSERSFIDESCEIGQQRYTWKTPVLNKGSSGL